MRTTLTLPDDLVAVAKDMAAEHRTSIGDAIAELMRRGLQPPISINVVGSFPFFVVPRDSKPITPEQTLEAEEDW